LEVHLATRGRGASGCSDEIDSQVSKMARDTAQHDDRLIWQTTSILWGVNALLLGYAITIDGNSLFDPFGVAAVSGFAIFLTW
jgi:hypothetical protein